MALHPIRRLRASLSCRGIGWPAGAICGLLALASCGPQYDPQTREGLWQPIHVNRANLTLMVANPADLVHGQPAAGSDAQIAAAAVERLRTDKLKPLASADASTISSGSNNSTSGGSGGSQ
jgi:hypothetical protein